jgi:hypothetical protein
MSWESIGSVNTGNLPEDEIWIEFCQDLAIQYIRFACGEPPLGVTLGKFTQDHELGSYPSIGVWADFGDDEGYAVKCENALIALNEAIQWENLKQLWEDSSEITELEEDFYESDEEDCSEKYDENQDQPQSDEEMYNIMFTTLRKEFSKVHGTTLNERLDKFLVSIYDRYTPVQLLGIEPYVKRFIVETRHEGEQESSSDLEGLFVFDIRAEIDKCFEESYSTNLEHPKLVVLAGGVCSGKTFIRRLKFGEDFVVLDAGQIFLSLSCGKYFDFGKMFEEPLNSIGLEVAKRAIRQRRNIVTEIIGASPEIIRLLNDLGESLGYKFELVPVFCDLEVAMERNANRSDDNISAHYTEPYHINWLLAASNATRLESVQP